jgi:hypothetical protein
MRLITDRHFNISVILNIHSKYFGQIKHQISKCLSSGTSNYNIVCQIKHCCQLENIIIMFLSIKTSSDQYFRLYIKCLVFILIYLIKSRCSCAVERTLSGTEEDGKDNMYAIFSYLGAPTAVVCAESLPCPTHKQSPDSFMPDYWQSPPIIDVLYPTMPVSL